VPRREQDELLTFCCFAWRERKWQKQISTVRATFSKFLKLIRGAMTLAVARPLFASDVLFVPIQSFRVRSTLLGLVFVVERQFLIFSPTVSVRFNSFWFLKHSVRKIIE